MLKIWIFKEFLADGTPSQWILGGNREKKIFLINPFSSIGQIIWVVADTTAKKLAPNCYSLSFYRPSNLPNSSHFVLLFNCRITNGFGHRGCLKCFPRSLFYISFLNCVPNDWKYVSSRLKYEKTKIYQPWRKNSNKPSVVKCKFFVTLNQLSPKTRGTTWWKMHFCSS